MKSRITLTIILVWLIACGRVAAQDAASASQRANQQYVLFESERDKGGNPDVMYAYLLESYQKYLEVLSAPGNESFLNGAKNRLRGMYPYLLDAAIYYSNQKNQPKALILLRLISNCPSCRFSVVSCCLEPAIILLLFILLQCRLMRWGSMGKQQICSKSIWLRVIRLRRKTVTSI